MGICPIHSGTKCKCVKYMRIVGITFLIMAWALWPESLSLEKAFVVVFFDSIKGLVSLLLNKVFFFLFLCFFQ